MNMKKIFVDLQVLRRYEYEEQFFTFSSHFFLDSFENLVKDEIEDTINIVCRSIKNKLIRQTENPDVFVSKIKEMKVSLQQEYIRTLQSVLLQRKDNITQYMEIPQNLLLKEDLIVKHSLNGNISGIDTEIETLKESIKSKAYLKHKILTEMEEADAAIFVMENVLGDVKFSFPPFPVNDVLALAKSNLSLC